MNNENKSSRNVKVNFPFVKEDIPTYANVVRANPQSGSILVEFGFFDPNVLQEVQLEGEKEQESVTLDAKPLGRIAISPQTAKLLIEQLQEALDI